MCAFALACVLSAVATAEEDVERFRRLAAEEWEFRLRESPTFASSIGDDRYAGELARRRPSDLKRRKRFWSRVVRDLERFDVSAWGPRDRDDHAILLRQTERFVQERESGAHLVPFNSDWAFWVELARLPDETDFVSDEDYSSYLSRLEQLSAVIDDHVALMRQGLTVGMTQPKIVLVGRDAPIRAQLVEDPVESTFFRPFRDLPAADPRRGAAKRVIAAEIVPAFGRLLAFFTGDYAAGARDTISAADLPDGERFYADEVRYYTTLDLSPEEIHTLGEAEVARIRGEMDEILRSLEFSGEFSDFLRFLREDPRFYAKTARELLAAASYHAKRIDGALPKLFGVLPRQPYGVAPIPDEIAPFFTAGRYVPAPRESSRAGTYWVNTHDLPSRTLYTLPALTLHEAVPGHHLQIALAQEAGEQPPFRRHDYISAFGEGWALYAEFLGVEAGIYETPYEHFGRLTYEMWRACRLVIDTGIHAFGWDRARAVAYLADNTALSLQEVTTEVDRYISWPAQALSYKLGELEIKKLRRRAESELGDGFDLRRFHDAVLRGGSVPLPLLRERVERHIVESRKQ